MNTELSHGQAEPNNAWWQFDIAKKKEALLLQQILKEKNIHLSFRKIAFINELFKFVAEKFHISVQEICLPGRKRPIIDARSIIIYFLATRTDLPLDGIGWFFEEQHHSTIIHALRTHPLRLNEEEYYLIFQSTRRYFSSQRPVKREWSEWINQMIGKESLIKKPANVSEAKGSLVGRTNSIVMVPRDKLQESLQSFLKFRGITADHLVVKYLEGKGGGSETDLEEEVKNLCRSMSLEYQESLFKNYLLKVFHSTKAA